MELSTVHKWHCRKLATTTTGIKMQHRDVIYISSIVLSTDLPSSRVRSSPSLTNSVDGPSIRQWKGKSRLDFPVVPAVEAKFFFLLIAIWTSKNMYIYIFFFSPWNDANDTANGGSKRDDTVT